MAACMGCEQLTRLRNARFRWLQISGEQAMMAEIFARGPISCGVDASPIETYKGGIFYDHTGADEINHIISIVGWGEGVDANGKPLPYWVIRYACPLLRSACAVPSHGASLPLRHDRVPFGCVRPCSRCSNSWGTYWGEQGFMRLVRGVDNLGIEEQCGWAVPTKFW
ncbi:hypothetical protein EON66_07150 [archaeon]|nr:MAG: hypothetical protein EON66_07150 [archaeon]